MATRKPVGKKPVNKATMKTKPKSNRMQASRSKPTMKTSKKYSGPELGQKVYDFGLPSTDGDFSLSSMQGKYVVLYFYPKDATSGCTIEGHDFSALKDKFNDLGAEIYGVSRDTMKSHEKFKDKQGYSIHLISDPEEVACRIFDVIQQKNMYGKMVKGIERSTFIVDPEGRLAAEWRKVSVPGHAQAVYEKLTELIEG